MVVRSKHRELPVARVPVPWCVAATEVIEHIAEALREFIKLLRREPHRRLGERSVDLRIAA